MLMRMQQSQNNCLGFLTCGRLTDNDYKNFLIPDVQSAIDEHGEVRLLFMLKDFNGWQAKAAWDDLSFGLQINPKVEKIAIVGHHFWEDWTARLVNIFCHAQVKFFDEKEQDQAWDWLKS